jgi:DUF4097 and DUF4098 domain-containing protein YvlB
MTPGIVSTNSDPLKEADMRRILIFGLSLLSAASAAFSFETVKDLRLPADGLKRISVIAGAGSLSIVGVEGLSAIEVRAQIVVRGVSEKRIESYLKDHLRLSLEKNGEEAVLTGEIENNGFSFFSPGKASVDLTVRVPRGLALAVDDGSGGMTIEKIKGDVFIDDGSGSMTISDIEGNLKIVDGSGDIEVRNVTGDVKIDDGSGSLEVIHVEGGVTVDDGSGSIRVEDVARDLILESTGSGGLHTSGIRGRIVR